MNIWTNGCFDILHIGHIKLFEYAKSLGDKLFVGIDSDSRIKQAKGNSRPINTAENRRSILLSIRYIDQVEIFDSDAELRSLLIQNHIDTMVIGDDYKYRNVIGSDLVRSVRFFNRIPDISTSLIYDSIISSATT